MSPTPRMMIFVSLDHDRARTIRSTGRCDQELPAYAATRAMITAHGYRPEEREDADYAAQVYAAVSGLLTSRDPVRLVIAAEVPISRVRDARSDVDYGAITLTGLDWADVTAVFVDDPEATTAVAAARTAIEAAPDRSLAAVLALPEVTALTDDHELLWHTPDESW